MDEDTFNRRLLGRILPRIIKAAFWGFLMGGEVLLIYFLPGFERFEMFIPAKGASLGLMIVFILFEVAMQLLSGTVFRYAFGTVRALVTIMVLLYASQGGIISQTVPIGPSTIEVTIEFRAILAMFLMLFLLVGFKNVMYAVDFLSEKSEEPVIPEEFP